MRIGTLGTGRMASTLARLWAGAGHDVLLGSRDSERGRSVAAELNAGVAGGGYDEEARRVVGGLVGDAGLDPIDAGPLAQAYLLEHLALLWIDLAFARGVGADTAFALLRREGA